MTNNREHFWGLWVSFDVDRRTGRRRWFAHGTDRTRQLARERAGRVKRFTPSARTRVHKYTFDETGEGAES